MDGIFCHTCTNQQARKHIAKRLGEAADLIVRLRIICWLGWGAAALSTLLHGLI